MDNVQPIRVLLADDHVIVREGLAAIIEMQDEMTVVGEAKDGEEAVKLFRKLQPDVLLLDLNMREMDGVEVIEAILSEIPVAKVLVLTTYDGEDDIYRCIKAGAKGYLLKDTPRKEFLEAIRAVHSGRRAVPGELAMKALDHVPASQLTPRELDVFKLLAEGKANKEIATALDLSEGTVKTHVNNILHKLGASSRTEAVTLGLKRGVLRL